MVKITGVEDNAELTSMMNGKITYTLNDAKVGTINNGQIALIADNAEITQRSTVAEMIGSSMISANMEGNIKYMTPNALILYSPDQSEKRREEFKRNKEELLKNVAEPEAQPAQMELDLPDSIKVEKKSKKKAEKKQPVTVDTEAQDAE